MDTAQKTDAEIVRDTRNLARIFVENHHIAWVLFIGALAWGISSYFSMPQRKDPEIVIRTAVALAPWPGATAEDVEELVTRKIEEKVAENTNVTKIDSISRTGLSIVYVEVGEEVEDTDKEFDDISLKLDTVRGLPEGAGPIFFLKDFGDTAALMLTVASPEADELEVELRARGIRKAIERVRAAASPATAGSRSTLLYLFAKSVSPRAMRHRLDMAAKFIDDEGVARDVQLIEGPGYIGWDGVVESDEALLESAYRFIRSRLRVSELHPDSWGPVVVRDPAETEAKLATIAGSKYSYRELDDFTDVISRTFRRIPLVSKVTRSGVWEERVYLEYSQERLAAYGIRPFTLRNVLAARNITLSGGVLEIEGRNITIDPSGEFHSEQEIDEVLITSTDAATPVYLRDLGNIVRGYETPPRFLNFFTWRDDAGNWHRSRAITLAVQMRAGEQIGEFGEAVDEALAEVRQRLPEDLIMARTSDQPRQVTESINQFMDNLYQAILLVILVALVGFREWRATLLIALSIPLSIAIAFGMMHMLSIDLQQVSIASLIIALGLLVDDPIVATDAIKRELSLGHPPETAAWLGPTKLAKPMYFTTATAVVAYLPFLLLTGDKGRFLVSLPIVLACTLIASRLVAMTFVPFFGSLVVRPSTTPEPSMEEKRRAGVTGLYYRAGRFALDHRLGVFAGSLLFLALGGFFVTNLHAQFFPKDFSYLSYVEVWLPEDAPLQATNEAAKVAERVIRDAAREYAEQHLAADEGVPPEVLESLTTFTGGGGPRFWFSIGPELQQLNYAQIIIRVRDKRMTRHLVGPLQRALSAEVPGARVDVRELETGEPVGIPVEIRISGEDAPTLRALAEQVKSIFRSVPIATRPRDDWGAESFTVKVSIDPDRANLAGLSNFDVAFSSLSALSGYPLTTLRDGDKRIPIVARLRMEERATLADVNNLYIYASEGPQKVPVRLISTIDYRLQTEKLWRRNQFRNITVGVFPDPGILPSQVMNAARVQLKEFERDLPPGYRMEIAGAEEKQVRGFREVAVIMAITSLAIYLSLLLQFRNALKPLVLFGAIPFGAVGALGLLWLTDAPLGFMAMLGLASLIGLVTSQVIVLFDGIEKMRERGSSLYDALLDSGITRMRAVTISVASTVFGLLPLALRGGPLWEPMTYAQIGGLTVTVFVVLLLVPVLYAIFVLDLKAVKWEQ